MARYCTQMKGSSRRRRVGRRSAAPPAVNRPYGGWPAGKGPAARSGARTSGKAFPPDRTRRRPLRVLGLGEKLVVGVDHPDVAAQVGDRAFHRQLGPGHHPGDLAPAEECHHQLAVVIHQLDL
jgi:hypothetical protein